MQEILNTVKPALLTATVFAAIISSIVNIIISILNNRRLKQIELKKYMSEIDKYRYTMLYDLILHWHDHESPYSGETASEIASLRLINLFLDTKGRYDLAKPLLDPEYLLKLDALETKGDSALLALIEAEMPDGTHTPDFPQHRETYNSISIEFDTVLKQTIYDQLSRLLQMTKFHN